MGSAQSYMPSELTVAAVVATGLLAYGYTQYTTKQVPPQPATQPAVKGGKKKQPDATSNSTPVAKPVAVSFSAVLPGGFGTDTVDTDAAASDSKASKKSKKKKGKKAATGNQSEGSSAAAESSSRPPRKQHGGDLDDSEAWTRVESGRGKQGRKSADVSDAGGVTTSVTGNSSSAVSEDEGATPAPESRRTLAEKMLPKPRKTGVDDMLETSDYPTVSRVMRVQPTQNEKPAPGFSWADYEDVHVAADDADGEDDGGWGVVKSRTRTRSEQTRTQESSESAGDSKKQRQNAAKRDAQKAAKASAETERLATLARHKRDLEKLRIAEQYKQSGKKPTSTASVNDGHLVWD